LVLDVLLPLSTDELESRLRQLSRSASRPQSLERIRPWLIRSIAEWQRRSAASEQVEAGFQQVIDRLDQAGQDLTETLAEGFLVTEATKQAVVRLQGEVSFEEQRSAFRGYSGASGTAAGTGRGTASYSIEEVAWQAPGELPEQVAAFAAAWQAAGGAAAERQLNRSLAECAEQAVDDWVYLIRAELESDLPELSE
jgi:hypothetical protein